MADHQFLALSDGWALAADEQQWIVQRFKGIYGCGPQAGQEKWAAIAFVGSTKEILLRVIREKEIDLTDEAMDILLAMPDRFLDWKAGRSSENVGHVRKSPTSGVPLAGKE